MSTNALTTLNDANRPRAPPKYRLGQKIEVYSTAQRKWKRGGVVLDVLYTGDKWMYQVRVGSKDLRRPLPEERVAASGLGQLPQPDQKLALPDQGRTKPRQSPSAFSKGASKPGLAASKVPGHRSPSWKKSPKPRERHGGKPPAHYMRDKPRRPKKSNKCACCCIAITISLLLLALVWFGLRCVVQHKANQAWQNSVKPAAWVTSMMDFVLVSEPTESKSTYKWSEVSPDKLWVTGAQSQGIVVLEDTNEPSDPNSTNQIPSYSIILRRDTYKHADMDLTSWEKLTTNYQGSEDKVELYYLKPPVEVFRPKINPTKEHPNGNYADEVKCVIGANLGELRRAKNFTQVHGYAAYNGKWHYVVKFTREYLERCRQAWTGDTGYHQVMKDAEWYDRDGDRLGEQTPLTNQPYSGLGKDVLARVGYLQFLPEKVTIHEEGKALSWEEVAGQEQTTGKTTGKFERKTTNWKWEELKPELLKCEALEKVGGVRPKRFLFVEDKNERSKEASKIPPFSIITKVGDYPQKLSDFKGMLNSSHTGPLVLRYLAPPEKLLHRERTFSEPEKREGKPDAWGYRVDTVEFSFEHDGKIYPLEADIHRYTAQEVDGVLKWHYQIAYNWGEDIESARKDWGESEDATAAYLELLKASHPRRELKEVPDSLSPEQHEQVFTMTVLPDVLRFKRKGAAITKEPDKPTNESGEDEDEEASSTWYLWIPSLLLGGASYLGINYGADNCQTQFPHYCADTSNLHKYVSNVDGFMDGVLFQFSGTTHTYDVTGWYGLGLVAVGLMLFAVYRWFKNSGKK